MPVVALPHLTSTGHPTLALGVLPQMPTEHLPPRWLNRCLSVSSMYLPGRAEASGRCESKEEPVLISGVRTQVSLHSATCSQTQATQAFHEAWWSLSPVLAQNQALSDSTPSGLRHLARITGPGH